MSFSGALRCSGVHLRLSGAANSLIRKENDPEDEETPNRDGSDHSGAGRKTQLQNTVLRWAEDNLEATKGVLHVTGPAKPCVRCSKILVSCVSQRSALRKNRATSRPRIKLSRSCRTCMSVWVEGGGLRAQH